MYDGRLPGIEEPVAIKKILHSSSDQSEKYFAKEISKMRRLRHPNIINLIGWCKEDDNLLLIYERTESGGGLEDHLYPRILNAAVYDVVDNRVPSNLSWPRRYVQPVNMSTCSIADADIA